MSRITYRPQFGAPNRDAMQTIGWIVEVFKRYAHDQTGWARNPVGSRANRNLSGPEVGFWEVGSFWSEFAYFRHVIDRRSEKKLGLKLALMVKSAGDLVRSQAGSFSSI